MGFRGAGSDGVNGFLNIEGVAFVNASGTTTATFSSAQFGAGKISNALTVIGSAATNALVINMAADGSLDLSGWTFANWTRGSDSVTVTGSTGGETIVGGNEDDTFVVGDTPGVRAGAP